MIVAISLRETLEKGVGNVESLSTGDGPVGVTDDPGSHKSRGCLAPQVAMCLGHRTSFGQGLFPS
jgi:hypothetical protein